MSGIVHGAETQDWRRSFVLATKNRPWRGPVFPSSAAAFAILTAIPVFAGGETPTNPDARVYFVNLKDGHTARSPVLVVFGLSGMGVAPAGTRNEMTRHHHLSIDRSLLGAGELANGLRPDEHHMHFGGGRTETVPERGPGMHILQLVLGAAGHAPHTMPIVSDVITIPVE